MMFGVAPSCKRSLSTPCVIWRNRGKNLLLLLRVLRGVWFQSGGRAVWPSVEPGPSSAQTSLPQKDVAFGLSRTITKRLALTFGSSLCLRFRPHKSGDPQNRAVCQTRNQKQKRAWRHVTQEEGRVSHLHATLLVFTDAPLGGTSLRDHKAHHHHPTHATPRLREKEKKSPETYDVSDALFLHVPGISGPWF